MTRGKRVEDVTQRTATNKANTSRQDEFAPGD